MIVMNILNKAIFKDKGQAAVEYLLMTAVVVAMIFGIMKIVKERFLGDLNNCEASQSIACTISSQFSTLGTRGNFQYFRIIR